MVYDFKWKMPKLAHDHDKNGLPVGMPVDNGRTRSRPSRQPLLGKYCRVEPFDLDKHHEELFHAFSLDKAGKNWTYLPYGPFSTTEEFKVWCQDACVGDDPLFHTIVNQSTNKLTGIASYLRIQPEPGSIEVGHIHFSPLMQGTKLATECMFLMMRRVFDELGYRRYEWKCNALNAPSCRAAERLGFQFEGIFRQATISKNQNRDTAWFAIIDDDWPTLQSGYERWLAEENFDTEGHQLRSLQSCIASV